MKRSRGIRWLGIAVTAVLVSVAIWVAFRSPNPRPHAPDVSDADRDRLATLWNLGIAHLENEQYAEADAEFSEFSRDLPNEPSAWLNLTLARLLRFDARQSDSAPLRAAVESLLRLAPDSPAAHILAAKAAEAAGNPAGALDELQRAAALAPNDPAIRFEQFRISRSVQDDDLRKAGAEALHRAFELRPDNLSILTELLLVQAEAHDPHIRETLIKFRSTVAWLAPTVRQLNRVDLLPTIDETIEAADAGNWTLAMSKVRMFRNVLAPQPVAQSDRRQVEKNLLEYAQQDVNDGKGQQLNSNPSETPLPLEVEFRPFAQEMQPPRIPDVRDVILADFDLDGRVDLFVLTAHLVAVLSRDAESGWKTVVASELDSEAAGLIVADFDQDAETPAPRAAQKLPNAGEPVCHDVDIDVIVFGPEGIVALRNERDERSGDRTLQVVPQEADFSRLREVRTLVPADIDHDGDLDLIVASSRGISLWSNRGDMTFVDISPNSELPAPPPRVLALLPVDWDRDVDLDLIVIAEGGLEPGVLENLGHGRFRWRPFGEEFRAVEDARMATVANIGARASWDLISGGPSGLQWIRTSTPQSGTVQFRSATNVSENDVRGLLDWDFDNDGIVDVLTWNEIGLDLFRGDGETFSSVPHLLAKFAGDVRTARVGDLDRDGDLDLAIVDASGVTFVENDGGNRNHWLNVALRAEQVKGTQPSASGRVNHYGVGSLVELRVGPRYQARVMRDSTVHFGLGQIPAADVLRVLWTNGVPENVLRPKSDQQICERQTLKGSCPYLYAWNGTRFGFCTDLLWAAPMGLQFSEGVYAPARAWEYLKLDAAQLRPHEGLYRLRVTEELWEAAYFDEIELLAIDHPADVQIFSNEKVGPAELAAFKIHTVRSPRVPVAARDQKGRDVLPAIRDRDGVFLKAFDEKLRQGLTEEHFLELDLGPLDHPQQLTLFLTGWIYPTDTSLNVALGQSRQLHAPRPPSIQVIDATGDWREVVPFMGFPGGKTKTIAVGLSNVFLTDQHRLRIVTSAEIYWDAAFFTVDEQLAAYSLHTLPLKSAQLRYRGFSTPVIDPGFGPETYDYDQVDVAPRWPPMEGEFTKYGDITELLGATDDRLAIIGSGDEIALEFGVSEIDLPEGWIRDFIIHNVGWDKDADLNTVYGQTVDPLPFGKMTQYPYGAEETNPQTESHETTNRRYRTRRQRPAAFWNAVVRPR